MTLPSACEGCPLAATAEGFCPPSPVTEHTRLVAWGEAPGATEIETGHGFTGASGRLLREWLRRGGFSVASGWPDDLPREGKVEDVAFKNVVLCKRPGNVFPSDEEAKECLRRHQTMQLGMSRVPKTASSLGQPLGCTDESINDLSILRPPWIAYGVNAVRVLTGYNLPLTKVRGTMLPSVPLTRCPAKNNSGGPLKGSLDAPMSGVIGGSPTSCKSLQKTGLNTTNKSQIASSAESSAENFWLVTALHPAFMVRGGGRDHENEEQGKSQDRLKPTLAIDARRALDCREPRLPLVCYREHPQQLLCGPPKGAVVSVDIEGVNGQPNIVGVSWQEEEAYVFPWNEGLRAWLTKLFETNLVTFHNASFDVPELELAGVTPPQRWVDTIVLAALYDPSQPMSLQWQVLSHVPGSVAWKGLVNHEKGPDYEDRDVVLYRRLWTDILSRLGRPVPATGQQWYALYNALDTAWGLALAKNLKRKLEAQGRWQYYIEVLQPLQRPLLEMGQLGMPLDTAKLAEHQENCQRWKEEARVKIMAVGQAIVDAKPLPPPKPHARKVKTPPVFNPRSPKQLAEILYDHFGLPVIKTPKGGRSVNEDAITDLTSRVQRGTAKVKGDKDECLKILSAITDYNHWSHWLDTFLNPPMDFRDGGNYLLTAYSLHRTQTGRLSSGLDTSDLEKGTRKIRKAQVQNIPKELRDMVVAPPGHIFVSGDYSGIEWAIAMWMASKEFNDGYHLDMLDRFFLDTFDPHSFLAGVAGCSRQVAKVFTHGYTYDGSPRTLARNAGLADSMGVTVCKAHDEAFRTRKWKEAVLKRAKKEHKIQTPLGWRCYNWAWQPRPQEVLARPVQGTAADLCKWVMRRIFEGIPERCRLVTSTHDSFLLQSPIETSEANKKWLKTTMEQPIPWLDGRQWRADVKMGKTWRDVS